MKARKKLARSFEALLQHELVNTEEGLQAFSLALDFNINTERSLSNLLLSFEKFCMSAVSLHSHVFFLDELYISFSPSLDVSQIVRFTFLILEYFLGVFASEWADGRTKCSRSNYFNSLSLPQQTS